jgi:thioredoxin-related protein
MRGQKGSVLMTEQESWSFCQEERKKLPEVGEIREKLKKQKDNLME